MLLYISYIILHRFHFQLLLQVFETILVLPQTSNSLGLCISEIFDINDFYLNNI